MNKFWTVFKANLLNTLNINKLKSKTGRISPWMIILVVIIIAFFFGLALLYLSIFGDVFSKSGQPQLILSLGITFGFLFLFLVTLANANSYIFKSRDFDLLMSLPLKPTVIVSSKLAYLLLINYFSFAIIYFPTLVVYEIFNATSVMFWVLGVIAFFLIPMLPIAIASFLAFLFSFIAPRFRYKNIVTILLTISFIVFIMYLSFNAQMLEENPSKFTQIMQDILNKSGQLAFEGIIGDYLKYLYFVLLSIIPFTLFILFIGKGYLNANTRVNSSYVKKNFKLTEFKTGNQMMALRFKELKRYFNSYIYVVNTVIGPIMSSAILLIMLFSPSSLLSDLGIILGENSPIGLFLTIGYCFSYSLTSTTSASISIEGKQFWILKSAPLTPEQVFKAKIFVNYVITIPFIIINTILTYILFPIKIYESLFIFLIPTLVVIFMSYFGLFINLVYPRFDYDNDVKAVKQSVSVMLTLLVGFITDAILIGLGILGFNLGSNLFGYILGFTGILLLTISIVIILNTKGIKLYNKLHG